MPSSEASAEQRALVLEIDRVFDAPRELIWRLWRDPEHLVRWHGPEDCALIECEQDFRVGGTWRRTMSARPGHAHVIYGEYLVLDEPSRLSFTYINEHDGFETVVTMDFLEAPGGKTRMLFKQTPFISRKERDDHAWGWNSGFNCLAGYLERVVGTDGSPQGRPRSELLAAGTLGGR
jgi:uncharacterized protein YndB with AHSA1/START domain